MILFPRACDPRTEYFLQTQDFAMAGLASCCSMTIQTAADTRELFFSGIEKDSSARTQRHLPPEIMWIECTYVVMTVVKMGKTPKGSLQEIHVVAEDTTPGSPAFSSQSLLWCVY